MGVDLIGQIMSAEQPTEQLTEQLAAGIVQPRAFNPLRDDIRWDQGPLTRVPNPNRAGVIVFTPQDSAQTSREGLGVWRKNNQAYKLFGTTNQFTRITNDIDKAKDNGLPYANASTSEGLIYTYENPPNFRTLQGFAVIATWYDAPWRFFSGQGNWQSAFSVIVGAATHNSLLGMQRALRLAVQLKVSDPQGFIDPTTQSTNSIQFIDIHYGSVMTLSDLITSSLQTEFDIVLLSTDEIGYIHSSDL